MEEDSIADCNKSQDVKKWSKVKSRRRLIRQCLVSIGVSLSTMELSLVMGYTAVLVPQLRDDPNIGMDKDMESWIASIPGLVLMLAVFMAPTITDRYGRRKAILISTIIMSLGWVFMIIATNLTMIIIGRILQGLASGISSLSGTVLVAEYTSPKYRGAFGPLTTITMLSGGLIVHTLGSYFSWHKTAIFCLTIAVLDGVLVFLSPESPAFLARRGRFNECNKVFHWLRDLDEDEELNAMIKAQMLRRAAKIKPEDRSLLNKYTNKIRSALNTVKKVEFYKPLIVMIHLETIGMWAGGLIMDVYGFDIFQEIVGKNLNITILMILMDILKIFSSVLATFIHHKFKRRSMLKFFVPLNILSYLLLTGYLYAKDHHVYPFDRPVIGAVLIYVLIFSMGAGVVPLANILAGEIFPLQYKTICALIITLISMGNITVILNIFAKFLASIGLSGIFLLYSAVIVYGFVIGLILLPETKDKTLQNIEEKSWKKTKPEIGVKAPLDSQLLEVGSNKLIVRPDHQDIKRNVV